MALGTMALLMIAGSAANAIGQKQAADEGTVDLNELVAAPSGDPRADPLLAALRNEELVGLGQAPDLGVMLQASPLARLGEEFVTGSAGDLRRKDVERFRIGQRRVMGALDAARKQGLDREETLDLVQRRLGIVNGRPRDAVARVFRQVADSAGLRIGGLVNQELDFQERVREEIPELTALAEDVREGRFDARRALAELQSDFPSATASDIEALRQAETANLLRNLSEEREDATDRILQRANAAGFNPARALGELEERVTLERQSAEEEGLARAVQLLSGQIGLSQAALGSLQQSLQTPLQSARATSNNTINALLQAGAQNLDNATRIQNQQQFNAEQIAKSIREAHAGIGNTAVAGAGLMGGGGSFGGGASGPGTGSRIFG